MLRRPLFSLPWRFAAVLLLLMDVDGCACPSSRSATKLQNALDYGLVAQR